MKCAPHTLFLSQCQCDIQMCAVRHEKKVKCEVCCSQHLLQNRAGPRQFLRTLTLSVKLFHGVLKRLHVLSPRVQIIASVDSSTLPRSSLSRRRSGRGSPGSRPGIHRSTRFLKSEKSKIRKEKYQKQKVFKIVFSVSGRCPPLRVIWAHFVLCHLCCS